MPKCYQRYTQGFHVLTRSNAVQVVMRSGKWKGPASSFSFPLFDRVYSYDLSYSEDSRVENKVRHFHTFSISSRYYTDTDPGVFSFSSTSSFFNVFLFLFKLGLLQMQPLPVNISRPGPTRRRSPSIYKGIFEIIAV